MASYYLWLDKVVHTFDHQDTSQLRELLTAYPPEPTLNILRAMVECIEKTDGVVDKFIGDAIMAIWGTPISKGNDTENAINAALLMRKELIEFNNGRGSEKKPVIKIGCGINTVARR